MYLLLPKQSNPLPLHLYLRKNSNCLLLINTIPGRRRIACREEAGETSRRRCLASLKTSALRLRRRSVRPYSGPWLTSATYAVLARPCATCVATVTSADVCWQRGYKMIFLGCGTPPLTKHSLLCWLVSDIRRLSFSPGSKPSSSNKGDTMISGAPPRVGTMWRPIYTPSCSTETMAVPPPTTSQSGSWGWSQAATVRCRDGWATRGVSLCMRRQCMRSTPRLGAFGVNRCRLRHRCAAISRAQAAAAAAWKKDGFEFLYFVAKTVGCAAK
jgi:hypothetical protein